VLGITVAEVILSCPEIDASVRQVEATRVAEHMRMHAAKASNSTGLANDEVNGLSCELALALRDEEPRQMAVTQGEVAPQGPQLVARDRLTESEPLTLRTHRRARCRLS
jgi:hypothetical protein